MGVISNVAVVVAGAKYTALTLPFIFALLYLIQAYYLRTSRQMRHLDLEMKSPLFRELTESSEGLQHIHAFRWEEQCLERAYTVLDKSQKPFYYMLSIQKWLNLVLDLAVSAVAVILVYLGLKLSSTNQAALGLGLFILMRVGGDMAILVRDWASLETSLGAVSRIRQFEEETPQERADKDDDAERSELPENWPHLGHIQLDDASAEYSTPKGNVQVLHNLSLEISGGSKIGIIGRTGSGKSSFLLTLLNFLKYSGTITIDGMEISAVPGPILRSRITTISQGLIQLPCSVRGNLVPREIAMTGSDGRTEDSKLWEALEKVGLKDEIERRGGLDTLLKDIGLSAGEKQLFALARALLQNSRTKSKVVFVDEATSNIDQESEKKMQKVMSEAFADCTVLTIAHRKETIRSMPTILEMANGRILNNEKEKRGE